VGSRLSGSGFELLHAKTPELPPASMCIHSMCRMKFSYCFALRITPIGWPEQISRPSCTFHVSGAVLTFTQPERSLPLNKSTN